MSVNMQGKSCFVDSNIWLYAFIQSQDANKHKIANQLVQSENIFISTQVVNEVCINLLKKAFFSEQQIYALVAAFYQTHTVIELNIDILLKASDLRNNYLFSFWDSLIVATALHAGVDSLASEDMQDGLIVEGKLELKNPFS